MSSQQISIPLDGIDLLIEVPDLQEESGPHLSCWWGITTASIALARHLPRLGTLANKRAIELGCGLGVAGIAAALLAANVTFTDFVPEALEFAQRNARLNGLTADSTSFQLLDWEQPTQIGSFDLVLGSEILYEYFFHGALLRLLDGILAPAGRIVLTDRKRLVVSRFLGRLIERGFTVKEILAEARVNGFPDQEISVFTVGRRQYSGAH